MEPQEFTNKVVLVTGASSGIGRASAIAFGRAGAIVVLADLDPIGAEETLSKLRDFDGVGLFVNINVSKSSNVASLIETIIKKYGRLDYAINSAGIAGKLAHTADCSEANWENVIRNNLTSVWLCLKYEIKHMKKQGMGVIVNMSSVYGLTGSDRGLPAYVASKHGIIGLTKTAALECASTCIRVNAICPGAIETPFRQQLQEDCGENSNSNKRYPMGRIGMAKEVANTVTWLCSEAASFVTGSVIVIDGGLTAQMIY